MTTQEHVSETLKRAVAQDRVGHAYLFCGPRGVGKTTLARVLAMALNCPERSDDGEPCGTCESCTRIWGGHTALDVVEIDAASNRGVDDARDLRERAMYAPSEEDRFKVYIVDEAHMLTREAWNALLKILEEPPPRVVFVFATTEPQKIQQSAAPILSRCQRFDLRRIGVPDIVDRLAHVLAGEGVEAPDDVLRAVARKADGGMRDALSLLDQVLALAGDRIELASVRRVLGVVEEERYLELLDILAGRRHAEVFTLVETLLDEGYDLTEFYHGLLDTLRTLLRLRLSPDVPLDLPDEARARLAERADTFGIADLVRMLAAAAELESNGSMRRSPNPRVLVEMLLLRLSFLDRTVGLEELIRALGGAPDAGSGAQAASPGGGGAPGPAARVDGSPPAPADTPASSSAAGPSPSGPAPSATAAPSAAEDAARPTGSAAPPASPPDGNGGAEAVPTPAPTPAATLAEAWTRWLEAGAGVPKGLGAFLRASAVAEDGDGRVVVSPPPGPAIERLGAPGVLARVARGLEPFLGRPPRLVLAEPDEDRPAPRVSPETVRNDTLNALFRKEPRLKGAVEELDLELLD